MFQPLYWQENYFTNNKDIIIQHDGLAVGAPSSSIIAEIFLQYTENIHLAHLTHKQRIINYFCYVDNILMTFGPTHTNIQAILSNFNAIHPKLQFTAEVERENKLNYLDITIHRTPTNLKTSIYRKPVFTSTIIPYISNHPTEHKCAAVKFPFNRLNLYALQKEDYQHELNIIHNTLYNNSFPIRVTRWIIIKAGHFLRKRRTFNKKAGHFKNRFFNIYV